MRYILWAPKHHKPKIKTNKKPVKKSLRETMAPNPLAPLTDAEKETIEGNEAEKEDNEEERIRNGENPGRRNNLITRAQVPNSFELDSDYSSGNDSPCRDMGNTSTS